MIDLKVTINVDDAMAALDKLEEDRLRLKIANAVADEDVLPALRKYPTPSRKKQPFKSAKSRRFFFAALRSGKIEVPYQRSGATGMSYEKRETAQGIDVTSDRPSAIYTRGTPQAAYFKGTWETHEQVASSLIGDAALTAAGVIVSEIG